MLINKYVKNIDPSGTLHNYQGQNIASGVYHLINPQEEVFWIQDEILEAHIGSGLILLAVTDDGTTDRNAADSISLLKFVGPWAYTASFAADQTNYMRVKESSFERISTFNFPGTNVTMPTVFSAVGYNTQSGAGETGVIRIFDLTNGNEIASVSINNTTVSTIASSLLSNLPAEEAIFEVQGKILGNNDFYLESINVR